MRRMDSASFVTPVYVSKDTASVSWKYFILTIVCACMLAVGFFFAAKQHFSAMDYGMKNSELRKQVQGLETEKRRLLLAREVALSPAEIKRSAKNLGFRDRGEAFVAAASAARPPMLSRAAAARPADSSAASKASLSEPAKPFSAERSVKKIVMQKPRTENEETKLVAAR